MSLKTRKVARNFLKRKRDQRESVAPKFLAEMIEAYGLAKDATPFHLMAAITNEEPKPEPKPAPDHEKASKKARAAKKAEPKPAEEPKAKKQAEKKAQAPAPKAEEPKAEEPGSDEPVPTFCEELGITPATVAKPQATIRVKSVAEAIAQAEGKHLGDLCGWSIAGSRPKAQVEAAALKHGLVDDLALPRLTPNACYRKAISEVFNRGGKNERKWIAVLVEDSAEKIVHSIVAREVVDDENDAVSSKDAAFKTEIKVGFDKEAYRNGASAAGCFVTEDFSHPAAIKFKDTYLELAETYLAYDIRNSFQQAFRSWSACPLLPHGGLWYIPSVFADKVRAWNDFMIDLGMTTVVIPAFDTKETIESLKAATRNGLEAQLASVLELLDFYSQQGWSRIRTNTLETRVAEFEELRNKAELYTNILGTFTDDLTSKVKMAADRLTADITTRREQEEREAKEAAEQKEAAKKAKAEERAAARKAKKEAETETDDAGQTDGKARVA